MWIRKDFKWETDDDSGLSGWKMGSMPSTFQPFMGYGLAHDVLEHFNYDGSIESELMAFGTMLWGRGQGDWWHDNGAENREFYQNVPSDLAEFIAQQGSVPACVSRPLSEDVEWQLRLLPERIRDSLEDYAETFGYNMDRAVHDIPDSLDWIRRGFRMAKRRWGRHMTHYQFCDMFNNIVHSPYCKEGFTPDNEMDKLIISVSPKHRRVVIKYVEWVDPYGDW